MFPIIREDGSIEVVYHSRVVRINENDKKVWVNDIEIPNICFYDDRLYNDICRDAVDYFERRILC